MYTIETVKAYEFVNDYEYNDVFIWQLKAQRNSHDTFFRVCDKRYRNVRFSSLEAAKKAIDSL